MKIIPRLFVIIFMFLSTITSESLEEDQSNKINHIKAVNEHIAITKSYNKLDTVLDTFRINFAENKYLLYDDLIRTANEIGIEPKWLLRIICRESSANTKAVNPFSGATGLIQWLPRTALSLGTTTNNLYEMSFSEQLVYVKKYFNMINKTDQVNSFEDAYLIVFYPRAIGKPDHYVIGHKNSRIVKQNPGMSNNGLITVGDVKKFARL